MKGFWEIDLVDRWPMFLVAAIMGFIVSNKSICINMLSLRLKRAESKLTLYEEEIKALREQIG